MKIVFVDIDGPLLPTRAWMLPNNQKLLDEVSTYGHPFKHPKLHTLVQFDPVAVSFINKWFEDPAVYGVISSNWVHYVSKEQLQEVFKNNGMNIRLHEEWKTPRKMSSNRLQEIWFWLGGHDVETYVIIDDDPSLLFDTSYTATLEEPLRTRLDVSEKILYVDYSDGLTFEHFLKGCKILGTKLENNPPHLTLQERQSYDF